MKKLYLLFLPVFIFIYITECRKDKTQAQPAVQEKVSFRLELKNANAIIDCNQSFVPLNALEYKWAILIDSDSDSSTGDLEGFDVEISVSYFKQSNNTKRGNILKYTQKNTWTLNKNSAHYGSDLEARLEDLNNTLVLTGIKTNAELSAVNAGDRVKVVTYCMKGQDFSSVGPYPDTIHDAMNDVTEDYIDIISMDIVE